MKIIDVPQSGKCGLTVAFSGRNGLVRRAWVVPSNPRSAAQLAVRSTLATQAAAYDALTEDQQNAWAAAASGYQSKSRLGQSGPLTGLQLFVKINAILVGHGGAAVTQCPARPAFPALATTGLVITNMGGTVALKLTAPNDPGESTFIRAAAPQRSGVRATPQVKEIGSCPAPVTGVSNITALYTAAYGAPVVGKRLFVQVYQMVDGWESQPVTYSALVPTSD